MGNHIVKAGNLKKAYYYLKKNGLKNAYYAAIERISREKKDTYVYEQPREEELERQREAADNMTYRFSILVPAYETISGYLREMIDSLLNQTYPHFELIIADASATDKVGRVVDEYRDERVRYVKLETNKGISENTNAALSLAQGDYVGLLDHDDILTPDALYEMAKAIEEKAKNGNQAWMLYSDEDKGNEECSEFYEPNYKPDINLDLLLSNNYICHFLIMKRELMQHLKFRREYDGAQDFDLVLRGVRYLHCAGGKQDEGIYHIPKVLYHWRCYAGSTAENPESKRYAYEAGRMAAEDFMKTSGWEGKAAHSLHLGFYRIEYTNGIFTQRENVGVVGGKILNKNNKISSGIYDEKGNILYAGLRREFSGYMHRASLMQEAFAVDVRAMKIRKELYSLFKEVFGAAYEEDTVTGRFPYEHLHFTGAELKSLSIEFCRKSKAQGYIVIWNPDYIIQIND